MFNLKKVNFKREVDLCPLKLFVKQNWFVLLLILIFFFALFLTNYFSVSESINHGQQYVYLSNSFIHGKLYFMEPIYPALSTHDMSYFNGRYYWPHGPMPAIVLMPFTFIFSTNFKLSYLSFIMVVLLFFVIYKLNFKLGIKDKNSSLWLSFFFVFSNIFLAQIFLVNTYSFSKIFVIFFLFFAFY